MSLSGDDAMVDAVAVRLLHPDGRLPEGLPDGPARNLMLTYFGYGPISNGGFDPFFAGTLPGDPHYRLFHTALSAVGLTEAADVFGKVLALFGPVGPPAGDTDRLSKFRRVDSRVKGELLIAFYAAMKPMSERLAAYIRAHPSDFPDRSIPPPRDWDAEPYEPPPPTPPEPGSLRDLLGRLSYRDRVAFAARCGRRVLPLFDRHWPNASTRRRQSLTTALAVAEAVARGESPNAERDVILDAITVAGAAYQVVIGTAHMTADDDEPPEPLPADGNRAAVAGAAAKAAENAARTALEGEAKSVENAS